MEIIFHIGAGKTGSSAIQHALATNRALLGKKGIYVPSEDLTLEGNYTGYQVWWFENLKQGELSVAKEQLNSSFAEVFQDAAKAGCDRVLFSAENLSNAYEWSNLLNEALEEHTVKVCIYIRRQDDYLLSAWQQWGIKSGKRFEQWLPSHIGVSGDWSVPIKEWQKIASSEIEVRVYERHLLKNNDIVDDLFEYLEIDADLITRSKSPINPSFGVAVEEIALSGANLFEGVHDNQFYNMLNQHCVDAHKKKKGESRLSAEERMSILQRYSQSNTWIKDTYLPDRNGALFTNPKASDYKVLSQSEIEDKKWALITELVYGLQRNIA